MKSTNENKYIECRKCLILRKTILEILMGFLGLIWILIIFFPSKVFPQQHPTTHNNLVFFVESNTISNTNHIAFCESDFCLNHPNSEGAIITEQYCDVSNSCSEGCVRRWIDQSSYTPSGGFNPPEYSNGRNFGQDDAEKPCYVSNCLNGNPCIRGGGPYTDFNQDKYLELQISDFINLPNDFSIFLLAKPIDQSTTGDWFYFGQSSHFLRHDVSTNNIQLRVPGNFATTISSDNSVVLNQWQLIEIHRDSSGKVTLYINGEDKTRNSNIFLPGNLQIGYLFSNFKTTGQINQTAMYGDIASFLIYGREINSVEKDDVRIYFQNSYLVETLSNPEVDSESFEISIGATKMSLFNPQKSNIQSIKIYNIIGQNVFHKTIKNNNSLIELEHRIESEGIFFAHVETSKKVVSKRIMKYNQ